MSAPICVRCGRPTADGYACSPCGHILAQSLQDASGHAEDAEAVLARQTRYSAGGRGGSDEPLPVDLTAAARYRVIENTIGTWARHVVEERGTELPSRLPKQGPVCERIDCGHGSCLGIALRRPPRTLPAAANWLATQIEWLRKRPEADEAFAELGDACADLARLVDRPADKELVGVCDCGKVLYAPIGRGVVQCPMPLCKLVWNVDESRAILRRHLDDKLVTAAEAAHLGQYLDTDRTQEQIRRLVNKWAERGQIEAHSAIDGDAVYRFGEIFERLATTQRRQRRDTEGAAA